MYAWYKPWYGAVCVCVSRNSVLHYLCVVVQSQSDTHKHQLLS